MCKYDKNFVGRYVSAYDLLIDELGAEEFTARDYENALETWDNNIKKECENNFPRYWSYINKRIPVVLSTLKKHNLVSVTRAEVIGWKESKKNGNNPAEFMYDNKFKITFDVFANMPYEEQKKCEPINSKIPIQRYYYTINFDEFNSYLDGYENFLDENFEGRIKELEKELTELSFELRNNFCW